MKCYGGDVKLKKWECVQVGHHKDVGKTIEEWEKNGWSLHYYQVTGRDVWVNHYLLFSRENNKKLTPAKAAAAAAAAAAAT
jgi:hypothetical protein